MTGRDAHLHDDTLRDAITRCNLRANGSRTRRGRRAPDLPRPQLLCLPRASENSNPNTRPARNEPSTAPDSPRAAPASTAAFRRSSSAVLRCRPTQSSSSRRDRQRSGRPAPSHCLRAM
jgi:hypothetical protein